MMKTISVIKVEPFNGYFRDSTKMKDGRMRIRFTSDINEAAVFNSIAEAQKSARLFDYFVPNQRFFGTNVNLP